MEKTPVSMLQEMMMKKGCIPEYECIGQVGPPHQSTFEYVCRVKGVSLTGVARTKKDAKQEAARNMLAALAAQGVPDTPNMAPRPAPASAQLLDTKSYVALLREFCIEYHLPSEEFQLVGDSGPPHLRQFTIAAKVGEHRRCATAGTKKQARQLAAELLYSYLKENLARVTKDFVEEEAIARSHERAMERYETAREDLPWRPHLGLPLALYHTGLQYYIEEEKRSRALEVLLSPESVDPPERLIKAAEALGVRVEATLLGEPGGVEVVLTLLELTPLAPELVFAAATPSAATDKALKHLVAALTFTKGATTRALEVSP